MTNRVVTNPPQFDLLDAIQDGRSTAQKIDHGDSRSRRFLYEGLARAYAVVEEAERDPDTYNLILKAAGLRVQARAPFTPALKLIFGRTYDKTRLTEYAAALRLAKEKGLVPSEVATFIENQPGGIKGCVRTVRGKSSKRDEPADADLKLEDHPALGSVSWFEPTPFRGELMILVARQSDERRNPKIIGVLDQNEDDFIALIRQISSKLK